MSRHIDEFTEEEVLKVVKAYLVDGFSHRDIQREILGLPAPDRGGGFIAMDILHYFDIYGENKGILKNKDIVELIQSSTGKFQKGLIKLKAYINEEVKTDKIIKGLNTDKIDNTEITVLTKQRVGQDKLRDYILQIYSHKCALCEINKDDLLICSHIMSWKIDKNNRLNPKNAICLCALHDKLFDKGYFSLDEEYEIIFSPKADDMIKSLLRDAKFREPSQDSPDITLLKRHFIL